MSLKEVIKVFGSNRKGISDGIRFVKSLKEVIKVFGINRKGISDGMCVSSNPVVLSFFYYRESKPPFCLHYE
jgi:hypothetical protein